jgi:hypothetical protein
MMHRPIVCALLLMLLVGSASSQTTSFTEKLLKFLGISASPGTLKGPGDAVTSGELWLADVQAGTTRALAPGDGYRSPIFLAGTKDVLALRGTDVMQVPTAGGGGRKLYSVNGIVKLVGASTADAGTVLILLRGEAGGRPRVGLLTLSTGAVTPLPYDPASSQDLQMVEDLEGWSRTYGDRHIYVKRQTKQAFSGTVEWRDVFLQVGNQPPVDVSQCDGANCGQPSLSADGHWLVFVKAKAD